MAPNAGSPLMKGGSSKSEQGFCAKNKKAIIIVVVVAIILAIVAGVACYFLLPSNSPTPEPTPITPTRSKRPNRPTGTPQKTPAPRKLPPPPPTEDDDIDPNAPLFAVEEPKDNPLDQFAGDWKLDSQEKFEEFLTAIGVGYFKRTMAMAAKPEMTITVDDVDQLTIENRGLRSGTVIITFNQEFEETTADGRSVVSIHTVEDNKWVQKERWDGKEITYVREIIDDEFVATITLGDLVSVRKYVSTSPRKSKPKAPAASLPKPAVAPPAPPKPSQEDPVENPTEEEDEDPLAGLFDQVDESKGDNPLNQFAGDWKLDSQEKFEEFLTAIGVGMFKRMMAMNAKPEMTITVDDVDQITIESRGLRSGTTTITFNEEFEERTADGRDVVSIHTVEDNKWVQKERWDGKEITYVREIIDDEFVATITLGDLVSIRRYARMD